jgi:hypothetical protein
MWRIAKNEQTPSKMSAENDCRVLDSSYHPLLLFRGIFLSCIQLEITTVLTTKRTNWNTDIALRVNPAQE